MEDQLRNKTVCHVTSVHPWDDIRIFKKEACSTAKFAHKTYLVATNAPNECIDSVLVVNVNFPSNYSRLKRILFLKNRVIDKALELDADIYHLHDPELLSGVNKLKKRGKQVVYDSHEDVPKTILSKKWIKPGFLRRIISKIYDNYEKKTCMKCAGVISVLPEITNKFNNSNLETIYNYPFEPVAGSKDVSEDLTLIYVGGLTKIRGIKEICSAFELLSDKFKLVLVGQWESEEFRSDCLSQVSDKSRLIETGYVSHEECQEHIQNAHIGLATLYKEPNYLTSLPIKAYEYATHELPVIMSDIPYWEKEFGSFAEFVDPNEPKMIMEKILLIQKDYEKYHQKVKRFKSQELSAKNWTNEEQKLMKFYQKILKVN